MVHDLFDIEAPEKDPDGGSTIVVRLHVQPAAGRTAVSGRYGDALKVRVAAPPEGGRANQACEALMAELFGVGRDAVALVSGPSSRSKRVRVKGVDPVEAGRLIEEAITLAGSQPGGGRPGH